MDARLNDVPVGFRALLSVGIVGLRLLMNGASGKDASALLEFGFVESARLLLVPTVSTFVTGEL